MSWCPLKAVLQNISPALQVPKSRAEDVSYELFFATDVVELYNCLARLPVQLQQEACAMNLVVAALSDPKISRNQIISASASSRKLPRTVRRGELP